MNRDESTGDLAMGAAAVVQNVEAESRAIELDESRRPAYLTLMAASLVPIFLAGLSTFSCQQRHYIESKWGGLVVLSSIVIYSFGKRSARTLTVRSAATDRERTIPATKNTFGSLLRPRRWRSAAVVAASRLQAASRANLPPGSLGYSDALRTLHRQPAVGCGGTG
jgi:hypothetical protein